MPNRLSLTLSAASLAVFAALASADPIQRATAWEWAEGSAAVAQSCEAGTFEWEWDDEFPNRAYYEDYGLHGEADGSDGSLVLLPHDVAVTITDDAGTRRTTLAHSTDSRYRTPHPYLPVNSLRDAGNAQEAWLETTVSTWETYYGAEAVTDLVVQWVRHWCADEDEDDYCDRIEKPDGTAAVAHLGFLPPMRSAERRELALCLDQHDGHKLQTVRREYQIAGAGNWPKQLLWAAECPHEAPARPTASTPLQGSNAPSSRQSCALFHQYLDDILGANFGIGTPARWFLGDGSEWLSQAYICEPSLSPHDSLGVVANYTGHNVRYWADQGRGAFPGFDCPAAEEAGSTFPSANALRFDTTGLRTATAGSSRLKPKPSRQHGGGATKTLQRSVWN